MQNTGNTGIGRSGEGSRPTTSGGVDNIGGADAFTPSHTPDKTNAAPKPDEKMSRKRQDASSDSAADQSPQNR